MPTVTSFSWRGEPAVASFSFPSVSTATSTGRKPVERDSCDSASSSEEASDSDSDSAPFAKKKCPASRLDTSSHVIPAEPVRPAAKYNIWGSVLQEQTLAKDLGSWFGVNSKVISDRDVETYDYRNAKKNATNKTGADTEDVDADPIDVDILDDSKQLQGDDDSVNICDRETFGTSSTTASNFESSERNHSEGGLLSRKRRHSGMKTGENQQLQMPADINRQSASNRLSKRTYDKKKDRGHILVTISDTATAVGEELVRVLGEPEHMRDTFGNFFHTDIINLLLFTHSQLPACMQTLIDVNITVMTFYLILYSKQCYDYG